MFTGLIETRSRVLQRSAGAGAVRMRVASPWPVDSLRRGESVSVDGACLTVSSVGADSFGIDVVRETLVRTTLGRIRVGSEVNLERSLRLGDRLGGHLVLGHVDATIAVRNVSRHGGDVRARLELPRGLRRFVARKGSVALHGVSLTVSDLGADWFEVALVPETLRRTTLGRLRRGRRLNLEIDLLARYLDRLTEGRDRRNGAG